jgi:chemotaxis signal transduction protein
MSDPVLMVTADGRRLAFRMADVLEVQESGPVHRVPAALAALRGVTPVRGRLVPLVHLGALINRGACSPEPPGTVVVVQTELGVVAFEVEAADASPGAEVVPAPEESALPWVEGVLRRDDGWVPVLNLDALVERLRSHEVTRA